ncbi:MAG TPA: hypothetical protein VD999_01705 [Vitreimonas sp.]|nr:hypothetical protein [Vitreimonas sp.]
MAAIVENKPTRKQFDFRSYLRWGKDKVNASEQSSAVNPAVYEELKTAVYALRGEGAPSRQLPLSHLEVGKQHTVALGDKKTLELTLSQQEVVPTLDLLAKQLRSSAQVEVSNKGDFDETYTLQVQGDHNFTIKATNFAQGRFNGFATRYQCELTFELAKATLSEPVLPVEPTPEELVVNEKFSPVRLNSYLEKFLQPGATFTEEELMVLDQILVKNNFKVALQIVDGVKVYEDPRRMVEVKIHPVIGQVGIFKAEMSKGSNNSFRPLDDEVIEKMDQIERVFGPDTSTERLVEIVAYSLLVNKELIYHPRVYGHDKMPTKFIVAGATDSEKIVQTLPKTLPEFLFLLSQLSITSQKRAEQRAKEGFAALLAE